MLKAIFNSTAKMGLDHLGLALNIGAMTFSTMMVMGMDEGRYQSAAWDRTFGGCYIADEKAAAIAEKQAAPAARLPEMIVVDHKKQVQPALAAEMIALLKELARRVMEGTAPVGELMSMVDTVQRMGIDVMDFMAVGPAFHSHSLSAEQAA